MVNTIVEDEIRFACTNDLKHEFFFVWLHCDYVDLPVTKVLKKDFDILCKDTAHKRVNSNFSCTFYFEEVV